MVNGPVTLTLKELSNRVLTQADMAMSSNDFVSEAEMITYLNSALAEVHDILSNVYQDYFVSRIQLTMATGQESILLPADFQRALKIFNVSGGVRIPVKNFSLEEMDRYTDDLQVTMSAQTISLYRYRISGEQLWLLPTPSASDVFEMWYVPRYQYLDNMHDTVHFSVPVMWADYVIWDTVARLLAKEESDMSYAVAKKEESRNRIIASASRRDAAQPTRIVDLYPDTDYLGR